MLWIALAALVTVAPQQCDFETTASVDVRAMARAPGNWLGRCVRVDGYVIRNEFYSDVAGFYASAGNDSTDRRNDGWLGLYSQGRNWPEQLLKASVVGVVADCETDYEAAAASAGPNTIIMPTGYCHYTSGLVLGRAMIKERGPGAFRRQMGVTARAAFGDFVGPWPETAVPPEVIGLVNRLVGAVRNRDLAAIRAFVSPWSETFDNDDRGADAFWSFALGDDASPLAVLRNPAADVQRAYFVERQNRVDIEFGYFPSWHVCFCRTDDCSEVWPISSVDSDAVSLRPYFCVRAIQSGNSLDQAPNQLAIDRIPDLEEPEPATDH